MSWEGIHLTKLFIKEVKTNQDSLLYVNPQI